MNRPNMGGANRPGGGMPGAGQGNRPGMGGGNIGGANRPTSLPGNLGQPGAGGQGNRPGLNGGNRPTPLPGNINQPGLGGQVNRPGLGGQGNRPGFNGGNRPSTLPGSINQPGLGGQGNRPGLGLQGNRPGLGGQGTRPGVNDLSSRPNFGTGNRPNTLPGGISNLPNGGNQGLNRPSTLPGINSRPGSGNWGNNVGNNNWGNNNFGNGSHWGNSGHWNSNHWGNNNFNNININQNNFGYGGWGGSNYWGGGGWGYNNWGWNNHPWGAWAATTAAVGLTSWALGSSFYNCGYASYANPYYVPTQYVAYASPAIDYSAPIATQSYAQPASNTTIIVNNDPNQSATAPAATTTPSTQPGQTSPAPAAAVTAEDEAATLYNSAADAFKASDYNTALKQAETALSKMPGNTTLHQFRALCLFAMGKYPDAAGTLFATLTVEPGWDWTALSSFYPSVAVYTEQLRKLEAYTKANPKAADGHFVLGYHYLCAGHSDAALKQYKEVVSLQPQDQLSTQMVRMLSPQDAPTATPAGGDPKTAPQPNPADPAAKPAVPAGKPPATVVGNWKAPGTGGGEIELGMKDDGSFEWKYSNQGKTNAFGGKYEINQDMLVLENSQGQTMVARVTDAGENKFKFEMMGGPPNDPGLTFSK